jgi:membrane-bound lytic murein transglycosylase B
MQFLPATWRAYATDGDGDGRMDVHDPADAIATAGKLLCANGGGDRSTLATSIWNYNHSWEYVARVLDVAAQLQTAKGADT